MIQKAEPLLTIAIPTYNRAKFLHRCLLAIKEQIFDINDLVEIIVSDNCSSDETEDTVRSLVSTDFKVQYVKNIENKGFDYNVSQCFRLAKGKYVLAMGDDDFLKQGSLSHIIDILNQGEYGVVFMKAAIINDDKKIGNKINYKIYENPHLFIKEVTHNITFISANIINLKYLKNLNLEEYYGTSIVQAPLVLSAITMANENVIIETEMFNYQSGNSANFETLKVFSTNIVSILNKFNKNIRTIIINQILFDFMSIIILNRASNERNKNQSTHFRKSYSNYLRYWIFIYPVESLPLNLAKYYRTFFLSVKNPRFLIDRIKR